MTALKSIAHHGSKGSLDKRLRSLGDPWTSRPSNFTLRPAVCVLPNRGGDEERLDQHYRPISATPRKARQIKAGYIRRHGHLTSAIVDEPSVHFTSIGLWLDGLCFYELRKLALEGLDRTATPALRDRL